MEQFIGLDAGSVSVKLAVLDRDGNILKTLYVRHKGRPLTVAYELLRDLDPAHSLCVTGSAGRLIAQTFGLDPLNEVIAQSYSTKNLYPEVRTIIEIGGEDSKLILLEDGKVKEFSMNSVCAAGTGSFLDQQAERLRLSIEEFSEIALESKNPPRIAGRCSVFAKSDMIHLQQIATPLKDIVAGLCFAVARNFKGSICKNMILSEPISFQGGVAANKGVVRAFKEVFKLESLIIPEFFSLMPAIGAALKNREQGTKNLYDIDKLKNFILSPSNEEKGLEVLNDSNELRVTCLSGRQASYELKDKNNIQNSELNSSLVSHPSPRINAFLGIDIGSISTNLAVIDEDGRLLSKRYLMTSGKPIEAVKQGLGEIGSEIGAKVRIIGVGTTGSGRYMIADFVGADIVKNEITAQAQAAIEVDPEVDTIFEIGGQDSKYISLKDKIIVDFEMNKACAAGTGSFLEEQAEKLDISIKEEFSSMAFQSNCPSSLGERCTVFMENSLLARQQRGVPKEDLVAGLSYSIVQNYINRVVGEREIGNKIFFQGGVAFNKAIIAAFEKYLNKKIIIPPHHDVTGAIGMAIIAMRHMKTENTEHRAQNLPTGQAGTEYPEKLRNGAPKNRDLRFATTGSASCKTSLWDKQVSDSNGHEDYVPFADQYSLTGFKGFDLSQKGYEITSFECKGCDNICEINRVQIDGEKDPLYYGSRCEKYDVKRKKKYLLNSKIPDLFSERKQFLTKAHNEYRNALREKRGALKKKDLSPVNHHPLPIKIGIPNIFFFHDVLPFWSVLLWELGFEVVTSSDTNRQIINKGIESIHVESCFPHKVAHGHIRDLINRKVNAILVPSFINFNYANETMRSFACPYAQSLPYVANIAFRENGHFPEGIRLLAPVINFELGEKYVLKEIYKALRPFRISMGRIKKAHLKAREAQQEFIFAIKNRGRELLEKINDKTIVITGRSYNSFDPGINLEIPRKLSDLGVFSIPMDFLPYEEIDIENKWPNMYWRSGQSILKAAEIVRENPNLFSIYIGNFSCGPDSFIQRYFKETMAGKPFLQIEIDEHSADAGIITRCEAFLDSIISRNKITVNKPKKLIPLSISKKSNNRIMYIPRMSDHAFGIAAAFETCGLNAEVIPAPDAETVKIGRRYLSGKECYPCTITTGDMVKKATSKDFDPSRAAFFMPSGSGPCRFGQYNILNRLVLDEIGFPLVPIYSPNQDVSFYKDLDIVGKHFTKHAWKGIIATELLMKCLHETRPYETSRGKSESMYNEYLLKINRTIKSQNGAIDELLNSMQRDFSLIPRTNGRKPVIGIIGEIFVRHNVFSNEDIIRKVEALGGEVWLAPIEEWFYYVNSMAFRKAFIKLRYNLFSRDHVEDIVRIITTRLIQKKIEHRFSKPFKNYLKTLSEPSTKETLRNALPYVHDSFEGEAVLSIGKAIDFVKKGASGIINTIPFGCMPGTIVSALLQGLKQDTGIPCFSIAYDGAESTCSSIHLEAFMHQAQEYSERKGSPVF